MNKIDRRLLKTRLLVYAIADTPSQTEYQYIVGSNPSGAFNGATPNSIAYYENEKWNFISPETDGLEVFCIAAQALLRWNGSSWVKEMSFKVPDIGPYTFRHIITQEEIENKSCDIYLFNTETYHSYDYIYQYEGLFLNGVLQNCRYTHNSAYNGVFPLDFSFARGATILDFFSSTLNLEKVTVVWQDGFNNLDIRAGDIVDLQLLVTYIPK